MQGGAGGSGIDSDGGNGDGVKLLSRIRIFVSIYSKHKSNFA